MRSAMHPGRRHWLQALAALSAAPSLAHAASKAVTVNEAASASVQEARVLGFPADHGAHLEARTEWWYATG